MKVVLLGRYTKGDILSGPEKVAKRLHHYLYKLNIDVTFIDYFFKHSDRKSNVFLRLFGEEKVRNTHKVIRFGIIRIFFYLLRVQPDIIHVVTSERFIIPLFLYKIFLNGKLLVTKHSILKQEFTLLHEATFKKGKYKDILLEWLEMKLADAIFFLSEDQMVLAKKYYRINKLKIMMVANGIDKEFSETQITLSQRNLVKIVFYNGFDLSLNRGLKFVIHALNKISCGCKFELHVIGDTEVGLMEEAKFIISKHSIMNKLVLIDFLKDKQIVLKSTTIDTFPIFVGECMAMGLIPVISNNVGIKRYIKNGINGYVYKSDDSNELVAILSKLIENPSSLIEISNNCKNIYNELEWTIVSKNYLYQYNLINATKN